MAGLPVVFLWQVVMYDPFCKLQRQHYDDLESSEEVIEEDEDTLEVMTHTIEIILKLSLCQPNGLCHPCSILSNRH